MPWDWLLSQPSRDNVVPYEAWLYWHYHILLPDEVTLLS